jgi:phosphatidylglycerophosphatase A
MNFVKKILGSYFGLGFIPFAPGTWGSFGAMWTIYLVTILFPIYGVPVFLILTCILSLLTANYFIREYGNDAPQFVMDEVAGQSVVFLFSGFIAGSGDPLWVLFLGFILFRLFDITKPMGIRRLEKLPGKYGILVDDLLAGFYSLVCLELIKYLSALRF